MMAATFERHISRIATNGTFPPLAADQAMAFLTQMQPIRYEGVKHYILFEILPAVTYSYKSEQDEGKMKTTENKPDAGITFKYGITSQTILDATINPDFSQVEADAGQVDVNLRYELFYPEKRPFFQEGNENFQVGAVGFSAYDPALSFVHTRNIADPLTGLKLSGKLGKSNTVSLLYSTDRIPEPDDSKYGKYAHFPVIRFKRSLKNDSYIGVLGTGRFTGESSNLVSGLDGNLRMNKSTMLEFHAMLSSTDDSAAGTVSETGHAAAAYLHSEKRNLLYSISFRDISENFQTRTGFIERTGFTSFTGRLSPIFYPDSSFIKRILIDFSTTQTRDNIYDKWETSNSITIDSRIDGTIRFYMRFNGSTEIYNNKSFNTSSFQPTLTGNIGTKFSAAVAYKMRYGIYYPAEEQGTGESFVADIRYLPYEKFHTQLTLTYQDLYRKSDNEKLYNYLIIRGLVNFQFNKYLFLRTIAEYNTYRKSLTTDFLISFTYIPGTVFHIGYGNLFEHRSWNGTDYVDDDRLKEMKRGAFVKLSYLFRL
jgi:hypothetical protein